MIIILFGALYDGRKAWLPCRSDRHEFTSAFCNTIPVSCLKFCLILEIRCSTWPFTISFQDDRTESSTISRVVHCIANWSTASNKSDTCSDEFLSQSILHCSLYFGHFAIRSLNLEFRMIEWSPDYMAI